MSRKIAVILFTDVVGYTTLMQSDEVAGGQMLHRFQDVVTGEVAKSGGAVIDFYGDGAICSFDTAEEAVRSGLVLQLAFSADPAVPARLGIHLGSVVEENGRFYGDAVNLASRIESVGEPGSILISKAVRDQIKNKPEFVLKSMGGFRFKNVEEDIEVFAVVNEGLTVPKRSSMQAKLKKKSPTGKKIVIAGTTLTALVALFFILGKFIWKSSSHISQNSGETTSIAVLPFKNFTGNEELEYFCDGITDDIIGRLNQIQDFEKVISRTSSFQYKNTNKRIPEIATELGVNTILEGSVQQSGDQVKVLLQLIDAPNDRHLWSTEYMGKWHSNDVFEIQKKVTQSVVKQMNLSAEAQNLSNSQEPVTEDPVAYELFLKAEFMRNTNSNEGFVNALVLYEKALAIDPQITEAHSGMAYIYAVGGLVWGLFSQEEAIEKTNQHLEASIQTDTSLLDFGSLFDLAFYYNWRFEGAQELIDLEKGGAILPAEADFKMKMGSYQEAIEIAQSALKLNPLSSSFLAHKAKAYLLADDTEAASEILTEGDKIYLDDPWYLRESAIIHFYLDEILEFKETASRLLMLSKEQVPVEVWLAAMMAGLDGQSQTPMVELLQKMYEEEKSGSPAWFLAMYYFYLEDPDTGFLWLERSFERHEVEMTWLREGYLLRPYRNDPRYQSLYQRMGWPLRI